VISTFNWILTLTFLLTIIAVDLAFAIWRRNKETTTREAVIWCAIYIGSAIAFGLFLSVWSTRERQGEFFAGWLTEYSLSIDNIFVFVLILSRLKVPKEKQQLALLSGITIALILRAIVIVTGVAILNQFKWAFFIFGLFLSYLGVKLFRESGDLHEEWHENRITAYLTRKKISAFVVALVALGLTDLLFALDSIPAVLGLTQDIYIVVTVNIFALLGLRQLFFLVGELMFKLRYITKGISIVLSFIGIKLILHAFHGIGIDQIGGVSIPEVSISQSLFVIVAALGGSAVASAVYMRRNDGH
jgi:tellurite resistance protein TerC